jgi:hypothetical protein
MTRKFAVNVIGFVTDYEDKYDSDVLEEMLNRKSITDCFKPMNVVQVVIKKMDSVDRIDVSKVKRRYKTRIKGGTLQGQV